MYSSKRMVLRTGPICSGPVRSRVPWNSCFLALTESVPTCRMLSKARLELKQAGTYRVGEVHPIDSEALGLKALGPPAER